MSIVVAEYDANDRPLTIRFGCLRVYDCRTIVARHVEWISKYGNLMDAIGEHIKDFSGAPIKKWYDEHVEKIAKETARKKAYYLNSKTHPKRS